MIGSITVVNKKDCSLPGINIGRPNLLQNPFVMDEEKGETREKVVLDFYHYLRKEFKAKGEIYEYLNYLAQKVLDGEDIILRCYCKPLLCHGDVIKTAIEGIVNFELKKRHSNT